MCAWAKSVFVSSPSKCGRSLANKDIFGSEVSWLSTNLLALKWDFCNGIKRKRIFDSKLICERWKDFLIYLCNHLFAVESSHPHAFKKSNIYKIAQTHLRRERLVNAWHTGKVNGKPWWQSHVAERWLIIQKYKSRST